MLEANRDDAVNGGEDCRRVTFDLTFGEAGRHRAQAATDIIAEPSRQDHSVGGDHRADQQRVTAVGIRHRRTADDKTLPGAL